MAGQNVELLGFLQYPKGTEVFHFEYHRPAEQQQIQQR